MEKAGKKQTFYYDNSISILEEEGVYHYYLNDELGSPVRVSGYGVEETAGISNYHSYGYDEFGNDLSEELKESGIPIPYTEQGEYQPFGYTGYRYDTISSTFFAQAREYQPKTGRFTAEDVIKGNGLVPETLNPYAYCMNKPMLLIDPSGLTSEEKAQQIIKDNTQYILEAAEEFGIDPNLLAGCIYIEQIKNVDIKDKFDTTLVFGMGFDSSIGVSQVKVSTAKMLQEKGYMPSITITGLEVLCGISKNEK